MNPKNTLVILLVVLIALTGIFRHYVGLFFTTPLEFIINGLGGNYEKLEGSLDFLAKDGEVNSGLGIFFYYGTYVVLHFFLIAVLFRNEKKLKIYLIVLVSILVVGTGVLTITFKLVGLLEAGTIMHNWFEELAGRPLILFLIEGGGLLYQQVDQYFTKS